LRRQRTTIEDSKDEPKEEKKMEDAIGIVAEIGAPSGCEEIDEEPIEEEVHDEEELKAESNEEGRVIDSELLEIKEEEVEEKHEDVLEVPCELNFIDMVCLLLLSMCKFFILKGNHPISLHQIKRRCLKMNLCLRS